MGGSCSSSSKHGQMEKGVKAWLDWHNFTPYAKKLERKAVWDFGVLRQLQVRRS